MVILAVALAGGLGACLRWLVSAWLDRRRRRGTGTAVVNLAGAFALGVVVALSDAGRIDSFWGPVLGAGLLGSFTTFSTWMIETLEESRPRAGSYWLRIVPLTLAGIALAWIGMLIGGGV
ncbi:MAG: CrcB family protein [bacterium]|nr:CrcB family protein [bacterium]MDE0600644.1 CrcB family protein [bacterium]